MAFETNFIVIILTNAFIKFVKIVENYKVLKKRLAEFGRV
jgi:hypothetical protein